MIFASLDRYLMLGPGNGDGLIERRDDHLQRADDLPDDPRKIGLAVTRRGEERGGQGADEND